MRGQPVLPEQLRREVTSLIRVETDETLVDRSRRNRRRPHRVREHEHCVLNCWTE